MNYFEYRDLTPVDNIENGDEYIEALKWAFHNNKIKNIALTGPYGAGKSSIIETFLRKDEEDKCIVKGLPPYDTIRAFALKISMATFLKGNIVNNDSDEKIKLDSDEIEKGILKQLFYKVEPNEIPQSRYRKLHPIRENRIFSNIFVALLLVMLFAAIFAPDKYTWFVESIENFMASLSLSQKIIMIAPVLFLVLISVIGAYLYKMIISKFRVKEIKLPSDTTVENGAEEAESVFNKNLDEIIYFFEATGYRTVFFEDLDRLDDPKIFVHLRELNNLLNNDDAIKKKPIVFVYAVKDDIFSKEDRTKFFDFIIPVIPVINSTNSGEILLQRLQEAKSNGIEHDISQNFVLDISPFISDMRILQNMYNEFVVYKKTLRVSQQLSLSDEQMFAMMVFKNLYPKDFADIQDEKGILKEAFDGKRDFILKKKQDIQEEIDNWSSIIAQVQNDVLKSVKELKYAMLVTLMDGFYQFVDFRQGYYNGSSVSNSEVMEDDYDMTKLVEDGYDSICTLNYYRNYETRDINQDTLASFVDRWKIIKKVEEKKLENLQNDLEKLREKQHKLSSFSIAEMLREYSVDEVFSEKVRANKLIVFLLRRGYIDEKYVNYINYFKGTSITKDDMNFILSIKNQAPLGFDYRLAKTSRVIERLQVYEFEQKAIYNFDLLERLLESKSSEKLMTVIKQLADGDEVSWRFIDEFASRTKNQNLFIRLLTENWPGLWAHISTDETLTYDRQLMYLQKLLVESELATIDVQNSEKSMTRYFEEHDDILQRLAACHAEKMVSVIDRLDVHFKSLKTENVSNDVLDNVFDKCHYVLNEKMIKTVISYKDDVLSQNFEGKPYSTLVMLGYTALLQYVQDNIKTFVEKIVFVHDSLYDRPEDIVDLLICLEGDMDCQVKLIEREHFHLDCLKDCAYERVDINKKEWMPVWNALLKKNSVNVSWKNVYDYWKVYQLSDEMKVYISSHVEALSTMDASSIDDIFIKDLIKANFEPKIECRLLPVLRLDNFDLDIQSIRESTLRAMIDCNYFEFTVERYSIISSISLDIGIFFILKNQDDYMRLKNDITMSGELFERLIFNDDFNEENKQQLFSEYAEKYITKKVAEQMKIRNLPVTKKVFEAAWKCAAERRAELVLDYCTLLNAAELGQYFAKLQAPYSDLGDRSRRHEVSLPRTKENKELTGYLQKIEYITSWSEKEEKIFDPVMDCEKRRKILNLRVKKV